MLILSIRTDKPEAEVGLFEDGQKIVYETWTAHRELSVTFHAKIEALLKSQGKTLRDLEGIACFKGPGSFTGLRIGLTVANTLAGELNIPITSATGKKWIQEAVGRLNDNHNEQIVLPEYGSPAHITKQKR